MWHRPKVPGGKLRFLKKSYNLLTGLDRISTKAVG